jgi:hypothetical protein
LIIPASIEYAAAGVRVVVTTLGVVAKAIGNVVVTEHDVVPALMTHEFELLSPATKLFVATQSKFTVTLFETAGPMTYAKAVNAVVERDDTTVSKNLFMLWIIYAATIANRGLSPMPPPPDPITRISNIVGFTLMAGNAKVGESIRPGHGLFAELSMRMWPPMPFEGSRKFDEFVCVVSE